MSDFFDILKAWFATGAAFFISHYNIIKEGISFALLLLTVLYTLYKFYKEWKRKD